MSCVFDRRMTLEDGGQAPRRRVTADANAGLRGCHLLRALSVLATLLVGAAVHGQTPFTEEALERGIDYFVQNWNPNGVNIAGYGLAFADLDNSGFADLLATGDPNGVIGVWQNDGTGHFTSLIGQIGIAPFSR